MNYEDFSLLKEILKRFVDFIRVVGFYLIVEQIEMFVYYFFDVILFNFIDIFVDFL